MSFSDVARRLAGQTALLLGWRPDDYWNSTPAELLAILNAMPRPDEDAADGSMLSALMLQFPDAPTGGE
ncbi:phage tail assembly chaperone [uncultured Sphingorhabdus sp.]|uniref:phage tail assembly chaperone n=1 Tax=uncultured Sphingorhabdus sp. TaxID=1686106 RepID=UPI00261AFC94|nr:phage tail assembly chaperone [uncultured Sphingorhabdus sp.]HMS21589.1 phage tail assembly chaperone [Sphingorhabdus sp.]